MSLFDAAHCGGRRTPTASRMNQEYVLRGRAIARPISSRRDGASLPGGGRSAPRPPTMVPRNPVSSVAVPEEQAIGDERQTDREQEDVRIVVRVEPGLPEMLVYDEEEANPDERNARRHGQPVAPYAPAIHRRKGTR